MRYWLHSSFVTTTIHFSQYWLLHNTRFVLILISITIFLVFYYSKAKSELIERKHLPSVLACPMTRLLCPCHHCSAQVRRTLSVLMMLSVMFLLRGVVGLLLLTVLHTSVSLLFVRGKQNWCSNFYPTAPVCRRACCWVTVAFITMLTICSRVELLTGSTVAAFCFAVPLLSFVGERKRKKLRNFCRSIIYMTKTVRVKLRLYMGIEPAVGLITNPRLHSTDRSVYIIILRSSCSSQLPFLVCCNLVAVLRWLVL